MRLKTLEGKLLANYKNMSMCLSHIEFFDTCCFAEDIDDELVYMQSFLF